MDEYLPITVVDQRAWYELSFDARRATIILRVHRNFIRNLELEATVDSPFIQAFMEEFGFAQFDGSLTRDFGFERTFRLRQTCPDGFNEFDAKLPRVEKITDESCEMCAGTGKDRTRWDNRCLYCEGAGRKTDYDWKAAYAISAGFTVFCDLAFHPRWGKGPDPPPDKSQLLTLQTMTRSGAHGGSISGMLSIPLVAWLSRFQADARLPVVENAMRVAYNRMFIMRSYVAAREFRAWLRDDRGYLLIDCPGDACGLHPSDFAPPLARLEGYNFTCHNVDSPVQQLTLIAGLAALCDRVRRGSQSCLREY